MTLPANGEKVKPDIQCSSLRRNDNLPRYFFRDCKYYYLPLFSQTPADDFTSSILGMKNPENRNRQQVMASLIKARKGHYSHLKIPVDRAENPLIQWTIDQAHEYALGVVLQVCTRFPP